MRSRGFTLIELLVVIAIIAVLAVVVVLTLNPAGLLQESRDANRLSDMATLSSAVGLSLADNPSESLGSGNVVYVSVPDTVATSTAGDQCQGLGLPTLPASFSWHCAASSTFRQADGTGWIPINLSANTFGSSLAQLPQDPVNSTSSRLWYAYVTDGNGRFEVTSAFESGKYKLGGLGDQVSGDGGTLATVYEKGSRLGLMPLDYGDSSLIAYWPFDEGSGTVAWDYSGNNATGSWVGTPGYATGRIGSYAANFNGSSSILASNTLNEANLAQQWTVAAWVNISSSSQQILLSYNKALALNYTTTNKLLLYLNAVADDYYDYGIFNLQDNTWHYVAFVFRNSDGLRQIYVDNVNVALTGPNMTSKPSGIPSPITIGSGVLGKVDDLRIYNRALSAPEIQALYLGGK